MSITHSKVSLVPNSGTSSLVQPSDWNADHLISGTVDLTTASTVLGVASVFSGVPTGACQPSQLAVNSTNGNFYTCNSGTWQIVASSSSSSPTIAVSNLLSQSSSIVTSTLYAVPPAGAGIYVIYMDIIVTTAGTGGTVSVSANWNNGVTTAGLTSSAFLLTSQGEQSTLIGNFYSTGSQNITFSTSVVGASGSPQYALRLRLQYLG